MGTDIESPRRSVIARVEVVALVLTVAVGLLAWAAGVESRRYDYDEVLRAHSTWLVSRGLRPYSDFLEAHPPYFAILTPVFRFVHDPRAALLALRIVATVGNLLFLGALGALGASMRPEQRRWAWLGVAAVAFHPAILRLLVEFRVDGWGYAIAAWSFYRYRRAGESAGRREFELGVVAGFVTLLLVPKLTVLPALLVATSRLRARDPARRVVVAGLAYAAGSVVALGLFAVYLAVQGIDFARTFDLVVRYNQVSMRNSSSHYGLVRAILDQPAMAGLVATGLVASAVECLRRRRWPGGYELAVLAWMAVQCGVVAYPFKQYYGPWFLFATVFLGAIGQGSSRVMDRVRLPIFLAGCLATGLGAFVEAQRWVKLDEAQGQARLARWIDRVAGPEDRVVASPPLHPVDRFDSFFVWFNNADIGGFDSGPILASLPAYRDRIAEDRFLQELEANPPALVLISGDEQVVPHTAGEESALIKFLPSHGYRVVRFGRGEFAVRPDRLDRARRAGR